MVARAPSVSSDEQPKSAPKARSPHIPDEEDLARWAAIFEGLPPALREAFDELGREIHSSPRR